MATALRHSLPIYVAVQVLKKPATNNHHHYYQSLHVKATDAATGMAQHSPVRDVCTQAWEAKAAAS